MKAKWEKINSSNPNVKIKRMKTPLGWLVRTEDGQAVIHIDDKSNKWTENILLKWEMIPNSGKDARMWRAKNALGWIIYNSITQNKRSYEGDSLKLNSSNVIFVSDEAGEWIIGE